MIFSPHFIFLFFSFQIRSTTDEFGRELRSDDSDSEDERRAEERMKQLEDEVEAKNDSDGNIYIYKAHT